METLEKLVAIEEIKQLKARYFRLIDTKQFEQLVDIFTPDAVFDFGKAFCDPVSGQMPGTSPSGPLVGREAVIKGIVDGMPPVLQSIHMGYTPEVEITSANTANAIHPATYRPFIPGVLSANCYGYYHETYEKIDGKWMIKTSTIQPLRVVFDE
ncbi:MAG: nuclear transport factor 2 family protein [Oscillospiraceae bacterium]|nr:nuclear transport factor 2 family protein [Oscillospiraceae bacterium]